MNSFRLNNSFAEKTTTPEPTETPVVQNSVPPTMTALQSPTLKPSAKPTTKPSPTISGTLSDGWRLTVYYTPVELYHGGPEEHVPDIGSFPEKFLDLVRLEGVGKISKGPHAGRYLHQTDELGFWLTDAPLDARGKKLVQFQTMAAPQNVNFGTKVKIQTCGNISKPVCDQISSYVWTVSDRFGDDPSEKHFDLYIGEEDRENYLQTHPLIFAANNASVILQ